MQLETPRTANHTSVPLSAPCLALPSPQGPGFIFLYHPALGPLWDVISQKVVGGSLAPRSELVLELAEARLLDVHVDGSLQVGACVLAQGWLVVWECPGAGGYVVPAGYSVEMRMVRACRWLGRHNGKEPAGGWS